MRKTRKDHININKNLLLNTYNKCGRSLNKTAKIFGCSSKTIKRRFIEYGLEYDTKVIYSCNESFFDELTEKSLYWIGYLATDGSLGKTKYSYITKLALATKDIEALKQLKEHINFTGPVTSYIRKNNGKDPSMKQPEYYSSVLRITSEQIFNRLGDFNIVPAKTYIYEFPELLKDHPLLNHFIRGCIDGDGWIREYRETITSKPDEVRIGFCGTEKIVKRMYEIIKEKLQIKGGTIYQKVKGAPTWQFEFAALHDVDKLVDWIYKDATVFLQRKRDVANLAKDFASRYNPFLISKEQLEQDYQEMKSIKKIAKKYGTNFSSVKKFMLKYDLIYKKPEHTKEYNYNFFSDNNETEEKYYWAGFLAGKSTLVKRSDDNHGKYLSFNSSSKETIETFLKYCKMSLPIHCVKNNNKSNHYYINIFDKIILSQLEKFGIDKNKQEKYFIPEWILNSSNIVHFVRGYLDAHSSLKFYNNKLSLTIKNTEKLLQQLNNLFKKNCSITLTPQIKFTKYKNYKICYLTNQAKEIMNYLYKNATIFLPKKYEIVKQSQSI